MRTATIYNYLVEANLMAGIAILLMILARACLRRKLGNGVVYFAWLLVTIRLLCPLALPNPAVNQIRSSNAVDGAIRPIAGQIKVRFADMSQDVYRLAVEATGDRESSGITKALDAFVDDNYDGTLSHTLMLIYLAGAGLTLCWFAASNIRFRYRLRADRIESISGELLEQYRGLCAQRGVPVVPVVPVYFVDPLPTACLVGTFRPYIALPLTAKPRDTIQVLTHEISHLKGRDHLWALLRLMCCVIHWFNPLVWLAAGMSRTDGELACDDRAIAGMTDGEKLSYANVLVLAAAKRYAPGVGVLATGMTMTGRKLKTRVNGILHHGQASRALATAFVALSCALLLGAFATGEYKTWPAVPVYRNAQALEARLIRSPEDAVTYAKSIWASPYLIQDVSEGEWETERYTDGEGRYVATCVSPEFFEGVTLETSPDGRILRLYNGDCGAGAALATASLYGDEYPEKRDELCAFLAGACDQLFPGAAGSIVRFRNVGDGDFSNGSQRFTSFYGATAGNPYAYMFQVQTVPVVRLVSFFDNSDSV